MQSFCALCIEDEATISIWRGDGVDLCNERHCISSDASWNHGGDTVVAFGAMCVCLGKMKSFSLPFWCDAGDVALVRLNECCKSS